MRPKPQPKLRLVNTAGVPLEDRPWQRHVLVVTTLTLCLAACLLSMSIFKHSSLDDPFISFRYSKNLAEGHGLRWNANEPAVEGYTNLSWVLLGALATRLHFELPLTMRLWGALSLIVLLLLFASPFNSVVKSAKGRAFLVAATAICPLLCFYAVSGMETLLFTVLIAAGGLCFAAWLQGKGPVTLSLSGLLFGLSALTRPEGVVFFLAGLTYGLWPAKEIKKGLRRLIPYTAPFFLCWGAHVLWRLWYYGALLPNTYFAKYAGNGWVERTMGLFYFAEGFRSYLAIPLLASGLLWIHRPLETKKEKAPLHYLALSVGFYGLYLLLIGRDDTAAFPSVRFFAPCLPFTYLILCALLEKNALEWGKKSVALLGMGTCLGLSFVPEQLALMKAVGSPFSEAQGWKEKLSRLFSWHSLSAQKPFLSEWIEKTTPPGALIAVPWAGQVPYFTDRPFLDMLGLNDAHIARQPKRQRGVDVKMDPDYVLSRKPALIFVNVHKEVAKGNLAFEAGGGWKEGDRVLLQKLRSSPDYTLDLDAPTDISVFRRRPQDSIENSP